MFRLCTKICLPDDECLDGSLLEEDELLLSFELPLCLLLVERIGHFCNFRCSVSHEHK